MRRDLLVALLIAIQMLFLGCSGTIVVSIEDIEPKTLKEYQPSEIFITDKDSIKYHFKNDTYFYFRNDALQVKGYSALVDSTQEGQVKNKVINKFEGIIPLEQIKSIEDIEVDKIKVVTKNNEEYLFENRGYYYVENDTLYGQGEKLLDCGPAYFDGKIAMSNIANIMSGLKYLGRKEAKWTELVPIEEDEINYGEYRDAGEGAEVTVQLNADIFISGELLSVRDSSLLISLDYSAMRDMGNFASPIVEIKNKTIRIITIEGEEGFWKGAGYGVLIGGSVGGLWGMLDGDDEPGWFSMTAGEKALGGAVCLGFFGAIVGGIAGGASSLDEVTITLPKYYDFFVINSYLGTSLNSLLKQLSRYQDTEPKYLINFLKE